MTKDSGSERFLPVPAGGLHSLKVVILSKLYKPSFNSEALLG